MTRNVRLPHGMLLVKFRIGAKHGTPHTFTDDDQRTACDRIPGGVSASDNEAGLNSRKEFARRVDGGEADRAVARDNRVAERSGIGSDRGECPSRRPFSSRSSHHPTRYQRWHRSESRPRITTSSSARGNGSGLSSTRSMSVNIAVVRPMPSASVAMTSEECEADAPDLADTEPHVTDHGGDPVAMTQRSVALVPRGGVQRLALAAQIAEPAFRFRTSVDRIPAFADKIIRPEAGDARRFPRPFPIPAPGPGEEDESDGRPGSGGVMRGSTRGMSDPKESR